MAEISLTESMLVMSVAQIQIIWSATVNITPASIDLGRVRNLHFSPTLKKILATRSSL